MLNKEIENIEVSDLNDLVFNKVAESKTLEYKSILKIDRDAEKREFLYDISSFANAAGGDIIFGITEAVEKGVPASIDGIEGNADEYCRKIESLTRDCISPRILGIKTCVLNLGNGRSILILRIPKSFDAPHQVTYQGVDRFYSRSNNGKYVLDVFELRNAFLQSGLFTDKIRNFIKNRLSSIIADETPVSLMGHPKIIAHIVPLESITGSGNVLQIQDMKTPTVFPFGEGGCDYRINLEGLLYFRKTPAVNNNDSYVQIYRNGMIESVDAKGLEQFNEKKIIYVDSDFSIEQQVIDFFSDALSFLKMKGVQTPLYLFLHLWNVKGYGIGSRRLRQSVFGDKGIDKEMLQLPEIVIQDYPENLSMVFKEWFDAIWNACGYERSLSFDANGNFNPYR